MLHPASGMKLHDSANIVATLCGSRWS